MKKFIIANWKMQLTITQAISYAKQLSNLKNITLHKNLNLVICPSFEALQPVQQLCGNLPLSLGAQNCSAFLNGAHTGQVSAQSLTLIPCNYCIIGHNEVRLELGETDQEIAKKMIQLNHNDITPIVCIGESESVYEQKKTNQALAQQLQPIFDALKSNNKKNIQMCIAYEPVWAIGKNTPPSIDYISQVIQYLNNLCKHEISSYSLIYGGGVNASNCQSFFSIPGLDGLLIGSASLDFQKFKKIVVSYNEHLSMSME